MSAPKKCGSRNKANQSRCLHGMTRAKVQRVRQRIARADKASPAALQRVTRRSQKWVRCSTSSVRGAFNSARNLLPAYQAPPSDMIASHPKMTARYHRGSRRLPIVTSSSRDGSSGPDLPIRQAKPDGLDRVHREEAPEQQKGRSSRAVSRSISTVLSGRSLFPSTLGRRFCGSALHRVIHSELCLGCLRAPLA